MSNTAYECMDCPKVGWLRSICHVRDFPFHHAKLWHKDGSCNCKEKMKLIRKMKK